MAEYKLTQKQENFCLKYFECGNASEAYKYAYNAEKMKPVSVNRKAFELLENVKITARVDQLRAEARERAFWTSEQKQKMLYDIAVSNLGDNDKTSIAAISEHNKMLGDHAAIKNENKNENSGNISVDFNVKFDS